MNQTEFNELHANCVTAFEDYATSAELTRISHQELATALKRGGFDWFTAR
jgi:hypothetical protein